IRMFSPVSAITICWTDNGLLFLQVLQTFAHGIAAASCLSMPLILYRASQRAGQSMVQGLFIMGAFTFCLGLNQVFLGTTLWVEDTVSNVWEIVWALVNALVCLIAARSLHYHAADLLATRQELVSVRVLAKTDPLTGLENRQGFNDGLAKAIREGTEGDWQSTLMLLDLDGFKSANDTYGHLVGDRILQRVAQILTRHARSSDCVARLGGDEFAIVWNQCEFENAKQLAESIRRDVEELWLPQTGPQQSVVVTASIGLAIIDPTTSATRMYELTDRTLYTSKREGKNQVSWMPPVRPQADDVPDLSFCALPAQEPEPESQGVTPPLPPMVSSPGTVFPPMPTPAPWAPAARINCFPEVNFPEVSFPDASFPDVSVPEISVPEISVPEISVSEIGMPEISVPDLPTVYGPASHDGLPPGRPSPGPRRDGRPGYGVTNRGDRSQGVWSEGESVRSALWDEGT
ncbi:MAG: GGDEF domain-containing protein, partial [Cyanobacteria bacterium P01_H01_bin.130]